MTTIVSNTAPDKLTNAQFLETIFGAAWRNAHVTGFPTDPKTASSAEWAGHRWHAAPGVDAYGGLNSYFSISLFDGPRHRTNFRSCHAIVMDDVGTKVSARDVLRVLGDPSWRLETSQGSEHWGYMLDPPVTDPVVIEGLLRTLVAQGLTDPATAGVPRYMRLPQGVNTKGGGSRPVVLREWRPDRKFAVEDLIRLAGGNGAGVAPVNTVATGAPGVGAGPDLIINHLMNMGELTGTRTGDGGWHLRACPWAHEHTGGAAGDDQRSAVWAGGAFKCFHGHCSLRGRREFMPWFNKRLEEESGGLISDIAQLDPQLGAIDPATLVLAVPPGSSDPGAAARAFMKEFIYVMEETKFWSVAEQKLYGHDAINVGYRDALAPVLTVAGPKGRAREASVVDWWSRNSKRGRMAAGLISWPGGDEIVVHEGVRHANTWRVCVLGRDLSRGPRLGNHEVQPWLDLVKHVFRNEGGKFLVRVLDWMALIVAEPGLKPGWHLIVHGGQGIGKDLLFKPVAFAVGVGNFATITAGDLHSGFNPYGGKRLVLVAELKQTTFGASTGHDQYSKLKTMTENTAMFVPINQKNMKVHNALNVAAFYITSNEPDALALPSDDRRFAVAGSTAAKLPANTYRALIRWLGGPEGRGSEAVAAWLRQRWQRMPADRRATLMGNAFSSASKAAMIEESTPTRTWTREQIESGLWPDLMASGDLDACFREAQRQGVFRYSVSAAHWGRVLRDLGGAKVHGGDPVRLPDGRRTRLWAVRGPERFNNMPEADLARAYQSAAARAFSDA